MRRVALAIALFLSVCVCQAHTANIASARVSVRVDGSFEIRLRFDVLAFVLELPPAEIADGPMNTLLDGPSSELAAQLGESAGRFSKGLGVRGVSRFNAVEFPTAESVLRRVELVSSPRLPVMMTAIVRGNLPKGAKSISVKFPRELGLVVVNTELPYQEPVAEPVDAGECSTALPLPSAKQVAQTEAAIRANTKSRAVKPPSPATSVPAAITKPKKVIAPLVKQQPSAAGPTMKVAAAAPAQEVRASVAWYVVLPRYVKMGFTHIIPYGLDHILFVLGLFFLSTRFKSLLKQVTAFTVAHSITLALSLYGVVRLPSSIVEPIIALSIVFVAVENLLTTEMKVWRPYVVFLFGLVHGLGFASVLQEAGLQSGSFVTALIGFNGGVELGQLVVIACAFVLFGMAQRSPKYRTFVAVPASLIIAAIAVTWTVQRLS